VNIGINETLDQFSPSTLKMREFNPFNQILNFVEFKWHFKCVSW